MRRKGEAGFSLVELLVASVLVLLALALAAQLLLESQFTYALAGREARDPMPGRALAQLRADVLGSSGVASPSLPLGLGSTGALTLTGHPAGTVRWERDGAALLRTLLDPGSGKVIQRRRWLRPLTTWRWSRAGSLLTIEVGYRRHMRTRVATSHRLGTAASLEERASLVLAQRGAPRRDRW